MGVFHKAVKVSGTKHMKKKKIDTFQSEQKIKTKPDFSFGKNRVRVTVAKSLKTGSVVTDPRGPQRAAAGCPKKRSSGRVGIPEQTGSRRRTTLPLVRAEGVNATATPPPGPARHGEGADGGAELRNGACRPPVTL